jgi:hypothetical protein
VLFFKESKLRYCNQQWEFPPCPVYCCQIQLTEVKWLKEDFRHTSVWLMPNSTTHKYAIFVYLDTYSVSKIFWKRRNTCLTVSSDYPVNTEMLLLCYSSSARPCTTHVCLGVAHVWPVRILILNLKI